ncbi:multidrug transporter [Aliidongia dinghuensis]|uniref:Multidrug transporter n=1 Tax=Aliidongia dinghuensis TaxID=1867774 RepID=A0A8J2YRH0_9PROT|nr:efflux RND transporter periplasmic adaptor subunit [Aliidongia dinghuensis]GGF09692.1 multidrug transporter [Aliidongia dinghuensis]
MMRRKLLVPALAMAGGFSFALLSHEHDAVAKVPAPAVTPAPVPVTVATATAGDVPIELDGLGRVQAFNTVTVRTQVEGQIQRIAYTQGQTVHKGDLLVKIDPRLYQAKLEQDQAALARDKAHLANAEANLNRYLPLAHSGFASGQQVDTQQAMVAQQQATLKADQAQIDQDQVEVDYTDIAAPIDGVAGFRLVDEGNVVHPTDANGLVTITEVQPIAVLFTLPQADLPEIQQRMAAAGQTGLAVEAYSQDGARKLDQGTLETTNNMVDAASGTITLRADFPNAGKLLWPGEFVQARLVLSVRHDGVAVPAAVVQRGPAGSYAWVVDPSGTAIMQPIQVAQLAHGRALVTSGLAPGQKVVTDGQYGLEPGTRVAEQTANEVASAAPLKNAQTDMLGIQP